MIRTLLAWLLLVPAWACAQSSGDDVITIEDLAAPPVPKLDEKTDFRLRLASGEVIDVAKVFELSGDALAESLRRRLRARPASMVRIDRPESNQPLLVAGRRAKQLDGPFVSYTEQGKPFASVSYRKGKRDSVLLTWDEAGRPYVFAQYREGKLDGLRCLFRSCGEACQTGHLWMVQQWNEGTLQRVNVVSGQGTTTSIEYRYGKPLQDDSDAVEAFAALTEFEKRFNSDEAKLKKYIANYYIRERQAIAMRNHAASQNRIRFLTNLYASNPGGYGRTPVAVLTGFR